MSAFGVVILIAVWLTCAFNAHGETLTCSTWMNDRTCFGPHGYESHETQWQGRTHGYDTNGDEWSIDRWQDQETITVTPRR